MPLVCGTRTFTTSIPPFTPSWPFANATWLTAWNDLVILCRHSGSDDLLKVWRVTENGVATSIQTLATGSVNIKGGVVNGNKLYTCNTNSRHQPIIKTYDISSSGLTLANSVTVEDGVVYPDPGWTQLWRCTRPNAWEMSGTSLRLWFSRSVAHPEPAFAFAAGNLIGYVDTALNANFTATAVDWSAGSILAPARTYTPDPVQSGGGTAGITFHCGGGVGASWKTYNPPTNFPSDTDPGSAFGDILGILQQGIGAFSFNPAPDHDFRDISVVDGTNNHKMFRLARSGQPTRSLGRFHYMENPNTVPSVYNSGGGAAATALCTDAEALRYNGQNTIEAQYVAVPAHPWIAATIDPTNAPLVAAGSITRATGLGKIVLAYS